MYSSHKGAQKPFCKPSAGRCYAVALRRRQNLGQQSQHSHGSANILPFSPFHTFSCVICGYCRSKRKNLISPERGWGWRERRVEAERGLVDLRCGFAPPPGPAQQRSEEQVVPLELMWNMISPAVSIISEMQTSKSGFVCLYLGKNPSSPTESWALFSWSTSVDFTLRRDK